MFRPWHCIERHVPGARILNMPASISAMARALADVERRGLLAGACPSGVHGVSRTGRQWNGP
jgi:hypothetical protein